MEFLLWLEASALGVWARESDWGNPILLSLHAVGMATVVGSASVIDFRILGFASRIPVSSIDRLFTVVWLGFAVNFLSGLGLFAGDAHELFFLYVFQIKIGLIVLGVISMWLLRDSVRGGEATPRAKAIAALSLLAWFSAIVAGRLIGYVESV